MGNLKKNLIFKHNYEDSAGLFTGYPQKLWKKSGPCNLGLGEGISVIRKREARDMRPSSFDPFLFESLGIRYEGFSPSLGRPVMKRS
jgi:hypothetical protein